MSKPLWLLVLSMCLLVPPAHAQQAGLTLDLTTQYEFVDCASGGSAAQTVPEGRYLLRVTDADSTLCQADSGSTCASGGARFPVGTVLLLGVGRGGKSMSCRSGTSTGDILLTRVQ